MNRLLIIVLVAFLSALSARAQSSEEQYVRIYNLIQQADGLNNSGKNQEALQKYLDAQTALQRLQRLSPDWNSKVINFRLGYIEEKISGIAATPGAPAKIPAEKPAAASTASPVNTPPDPATPTQSPVEIAQQLGALQEQVRRLATEKTILESKLKEALATQPAAIDPRELARAEEKIKSLTTENASLKSNLAAEKEKPAAPIDPKDLEAAKRELADAKKKIAELTKKIHLGKDDSTPQTIKTPAQRALYNNLSKNEELAIRLHERILAVKPDGFRGNDAKERVIKRALYEILNNVDEVERIFPIIKQQAEY